MAIVMTRSLTVGLLNCFVSKSDQQPSHPGLESGRVVYTCFSTVPQEMKQYLLVTDSKSRCRELFFEMEIFFEKAASEGKLYFLVEMVY